MKRFVGFGVIMVLIISCTHEESDNLNPVNDNCPPDTIDVNYVSDIAPLLQIHCGTTGSCHKATGSNSGLSLANYIDVKAVAETGQLLSSIIHDGNAEPMPKNASRLPDCKINLVKAWLNQGLKEN